MPLDLTVLYFAGIRERLHLSSESFTLEEGAKVADLWIALISRHPEMDRLRRHLRLAVNHDFADDSWPLASGDEVAIIPPVAGGAARARILESKLDVEALTERVLRDEHGAIVTFVGVVRNHSKGRDVDHLEYQVYPEMAVAKLEQILTEVDEKWPGMQAGVDHRAGRLEIGDVAVVIAVSSPHRKAAFDACEYIIDRIKEDVPIWKKEVGPDGTEWVGMGS